MSPWGEEVGGPLNSKDVERIITHMRTWDTLPPADIHDQVITGDVEKMEQHYTTSTVFNVMGKMEKEILPSV